MENKKSLSNWLIASDIDGTLNNKLRRLPERNEKGNELKYNTSVEERMPEKYKTMDQKIYYFNKNRIELCDLIDIQNKTLVHVKKYGASSVLSHLFLQALNSAELIANRKEREKIINYYQDNYQISSIHSLQILQTYL